jgi:L-ascorbate metabolism protein UlaG (beta-lactamase superfamily)
MITLRWFGHSLWILSTPSVTVATDPFGEIGYPGPRDVDVDIVVSSHDHFDHNNLALFPGATAVFRTEGEFEHKGVRLAMKSVAHDEAGGSKRGRTLLMKIFLGGRVFLHCGDLGYIPEEEIFDWIGDVDGLFLPVGGHYTIDADQAWRIVERIDPPLVFPQHYRTTVIDDWPISRVDEFLQRVGGRNVEWIDGNSMRLTDQSFETKRVIVFREYV